MSATLVLMPDAWVAAFEVMSAALVLMSPSLETTPAALVLMPDAWFVELERPLAVKVAVMPVMSALMPVMSAVCPTVCSDVQSCLPFPEFRQPARLRLTITKGRMRTLSSKPSGAYVGVLHACSGATASFAGLPARVQYPLSQNISATFSPGTPARATRCCALIRHTADLCTSEPILHPQM